MAINKRDEFTFAAGGDTMMTRPLLPYEGTSRRFDRLLDLLRTAETTVLNLETVVHDYQCAPTKGGGTSMRTPPEVLDDLRAMGCNMVSAATNHAYDYGVCGMRSTMTELESHGICFAGMGTDLFGARKPSYIETPSGRVALISVNTTITAGSEATERSPTLSGRPGINPVHLDTIYRLRDESLEDLKQISRSLGLEDIKQAWLDRGFYTSRHDWNQEDYFHFDDMKFREVDDADPEGIGYEVSEEDTLAVRDWIDEAERTADWTLVSVHSHEGTDGRWNTETTPPFLSGMARSFIDAGADAVLGTGPHVLRGMEVYNGKPIFYSLGNFIIQRTGISRFPPEMYRRYDIDDYTKSSRIFDARLLDRDENPQGDLANPAFWESVVPVCTFTESGGLESCTLYPLTLQQTASRPQRGIPVLAEGEHADSILRHVAALSEPFGTDVEISDGVGIVRNT